MTHKNIHEAINAVMQDVGYVKKSKAANLNYTFAGEAALIAALRPSMVENGIYMTVSHVSEIRRENYTTAKGTPMVNTVIHAQVKFIHTSGDSITVEAVGEGSDSGDKSANKAMTGLYKYAMRQTFCIETGDDPDKYHNEERQPEQKKTVRDRYAELLTEAESVGIATVDYQLPQDGNITDREVIELGKALRAEINSKKEGK